VYLTIGNIDKSTRRKPTKHATILLGYLPVSKLECFNEANRSVQGQRLFHTCMTSLLEPLIESGKSGVLMVCADGRTRRIHPILAAYVADHPEQCLVAGCQQNRCPKCLVPATGLGDPTQSELRNPQETMKILGLAADNYQPEAFTAHGLRPINPFWEDLPFCDIFHCFTPDILHQLHKGVFKDHLVKWVTSAIPGGAQEIDRRFQAMTGHPSLRHFKKGISLVSQWTGNEYKNMEKAFLGVIANASEHPEVARSACAVLDFLYYAHFETHTDKSLRELEGAWTRFHADKAIFTKLEVRQHFNIPKVHSMQHYLHMIRSHGTADGYNTEVSERLHIDFAKHAYTASNKKDYIAQMKTWLARRESIDTFFSYLCWAIPGYGVANNTGSIDDGADMNALDPDNEGEPPDLTCPVEPTSPTLSPHDTAKVLYSVASRPPLPNTTIDTITNSFHAPDFPYYLWQFLKQRNLLPPNFDDINTSEVKVSVFKRLNLLIPTLPEVSTSGQPIRDVVRATAAVPGKGVKKGTPAIFDTVLARKESPPDGYLEWWSTQGGTQTSSRGSHTSPLILVSDLCTAQVRLLFNLPVEYGSFSEPLAYVEWFKPLRTRDPHHGMFKISRATRQHQRYRSIIPVSHIARSCHLIPVFGPEVRPEWNTNNVLEESKEFYLNHYLRHLDFVLFRYLNS
jgi:hypothetical protein